LEYTTFSPINIICKKFLFKKSHSLDWQVVEGATFSYTEKPDQNSRLIYQTTITRVLFLDKNGFGLNNYKTFLIPDVQSSLHHTMSYMQNMYFVILDQQNLITFDIEEYAEEFHRGSFVEKYDYDKMSYDDPRLLEYSSLIKKFNEEQDQKEKEFKEKHEVPIYHIRKTNSTVSDIKDTVIGKTIKQASCIIEDDLYLYGGENLNGEMLNDLFVVRFNHKKITFQIKKIEINGPSPYSINGKLFKNSNNSILLVDKKNISHLNTSKLILKKRVQKICKRCSS
jgi:hypothetical protein